MFLFLLLIFFVHEALSFLFIVPVKVGNPIELNVGEKTTKWKRLKKGGVEEFIKYCPPGETGPICNGFVTSDNKPVLPKSNARVFKNGTLVIDSIKETDIGIYSSADQEPAIVEISRRTTLSTFILDDLLRELNELNLPPRPNMSVPTTVALLISVLLLLIYMFGVDFTTIVNNVSFASFVERCDCESAFEKYRVYLNSAQLMEILSNGVSAQNKTTLTIPRQEWYSKLLAEGIVHILCQINVIHLMKGGTKMNISLVAAYNYPDQLNVIITSQNKFGDIVYCRYYDKSKNELGEAYKSMVFPEYNVHCLRRNDANFMSLSDTPTGMCEFPVPIVDRTREPRHFFSVCIAPIYGNESKWLMLAEFIEHYKLQDCLLRARRHSRWVAFMDLDERLTLTDLKGTLYDYLKNISDPTIGAVEFRQRWILKNDSSPVHYSGQDQVSKWMPTRRYHNTSHVGPPGHTTKCIIDPEKVFLMNVHHVGKFFDGYRTYAMKPEEGVVRHYRDVRAGEWGRKWLKSVEAMGNFSSTQYPAQFAPVLLENVTKRLQYVYGTQEIKVK